MSTRPQLRIIDGDGQVDDPRREGWARIADGYRSALMTPGLSVRDRERFVRCLRRAERLATLPSVRRAR